MWLLEAGLYALSDKGQRTCLVWFFRGFAYAMAIYGLVEVWLPVSTMRPSPIQEYAKDT